MAGSSPRPSDGGTPALSHAAIAPYGPFGCGDGQTVFLGVQNEREWENFCEAVLGRRELAGDERFSTNTRRVENREALHAEIERVFSGLSFDEAIGCLEAAGVANASMRTVRGFLDHPQLEARGAGASSARPRDHSGPSCPPRPSKAPSPQWRPSPQ